MQIIKPKVHQDKTGYQVVFIDVEKDKEILTNAYITSANLNAVQREVMFAVA